MQLINDLKNFLNTSKWAYIALFVGVDLSLTLISSVLALPFYYLTSNYQNYLLICYGCTVVASIIVLLIYRTLYKDEYQGFLKSFNTKETIVLTLPLLIYVAFNLYIGGFHFNNFGLAFFKALASAFSEEVIYRGILIPHILKRKGKDSLIKIMVITSLVFSLYHFFNLINDNDFSYVLLQVITSFAFGFVLSGLLIRNGSLMPLIIIHFLNNFSGFITLENDSVSGLIISNGKNVAMLILISILMIIYALYLVHKDIRDKVIENWKKRWNINV